MKQQQVLLALLGKLTLSSPYLTMESLKDERTEAGREKLIIVFNADSGIWRSYMFGLAEGYQKRMTFVVAKINNFYLCFSYAEIWVNQHILPLEIWGKYVMLYQDNMKHIPYATQCSITVWGVLHEQRRWRLSDYREFKYSCSFWYGPRWKNHIWIVCGVMIYLITRLQSTWSKYRNTLVNTTFIARKTSLDASWNSLSDLTRDGNTLHSV